MARAVDEAGGVLVMGHEANGRALDVRDMTEQTVGATTAFSLTGRVNLFLRFERSVASWPRALRVVTLVDLCVGITQLDGNVSLQLVLESDSLHA